MDMTMTSFEDRLRRIVRKHRRMANGVVGRMGPDGLVTPVARMATPKFPLRSLVILFGVAMLFKAWMFLSLGAADFDARIAVLSQGTLLEQAGAFVMQAGPVTQTVASLLEPLAG
jgi:hypothetical protein